MARRKKVEVAPPPEPVAPPEPVISPLVQQYAKHTHARLLDKIDLLLVVRGATREHLETRHWEAMDRVLDATTTFEADQLAKKAEDKVFMTMLSLTSQGKLTPKTPDAYHAKAAGADYWAERAYKVYMEQPTTSPREEAKKNVLWKRYEKQRDRAKNLREYAERLRVDPRIPSFEELYGVKDEEETSAGNEVVGGQDEPPSPRGRRKKQEVGGAVRPPDPIQSAPVRQPEAEVPRLRRGSGRTRHSSRGSKVPRPDPRERRKGSRS